MQTSNNNNNKKIQIKIKCHDLSSVLAFTLIPISSLAKTFKRKKDSSVWFYPRWRNILFLFCLRNLGLHWKGQQNNIFARDKNKKSAIRTYTDDDESWRQEGESNIHDNGDIDGAEDGEAPMGDQSPPCSEISKTFLVMSCSPSIAVSTFCTGSL